MYVVCSACLCSTVLVYVCEKLSKNTGNGALCRMSFGSQPQRKELSGGGGGDGTTAAVASAAAVVAVGSVAFAYLLPLAPTCFRRPASLYVGRLLYVVELLGSRRHRAPQAAYLREVALRAANARTATAATDVRTKAMCT